MRITFDISICPTELEIDGRQINGDALLERIREVAGEVRPGAEISFKTLQIGHRQGDGWSRSWVDGTRNDLIADELVLDHVDWTDAELYVS